ALVIFGGLVPAARGVFVVRAAVDDGRGVVAVRQVRAVQLPERELQHFHTGDADGPAQLDDFGRDEAEVLGDERQIAERVAHRVEERLAGAGYPAAVDRCRLAGGDLPVRGEAAEVIDAQHVREAQRGAEA